MRPALAWLFGIPHKNNNEKILKNNLKPLTIEPN
jgi:hypothetical protein